MVGNTTKLFKMYRHFSGERQRNFVLLKDEIPQTASTKKIYIRHGEQFSTHMTFRIMENKCAKCMWVCM